LFVNPNDVNEIRAGFLSIMQNDIFRIRIIQNSFRNVERFNHKKITKKYMEIYQEVLGINFNENSI
jgi:glycosyltransferase involved in cell wall biosynthesis